MVTSGQDAAPPEFVRLASHPLRWKLLTHLADSDYRVRELLTLLDQPQNVVSYHLRLLRDGGLVTATPGSFDGRDSYYHLDLDRCAQALAGTGAALHPALAHRPASSGPRGSPCCSCAPATAPAHPSYCWSSPRYRPASNRPPWTSPIWTLR